MTTSEVTRRLAAELEPGEHVLTNRNIRRQYRLRRVTPKIRTEIATELHRAGLEILTDPAHEPLVVRKVASARVAVRKPRASTAWWRRPWAIGVGVVILLLIIVGAAGDSGSRDDGDDGPVAVETTETPTETQTAAVEPVQTIADAAQEVEAENYDEALSIAEEIGGDASSRIRRKISRHIAKRVRSALRAGDRSRARTLLADADAYPSTTAISRARADYRAAKARASYRAERRRAARAAARERAAARRAAAEAEAEAAAAEAYDSAPEPSSGGGRGPSSTNWCGKRDGDGDGIYCEG